MDFVMPDWATGEALGGLSLIRSSYLIKDQYKEIWNHPLNVASRVKCNCLAVCAYHNILN